MIMGKGNNVNPKTLSSKYRISDVIGKGGMGKVYRATDIETDQEVAVKFLRSRFVNKKRIVERFYHEAGLAKSIDHQHICNVIEVDQDADGAPYFVMELLRGESLSDLLKKSSPLHMPRALNLSYQILRALEEAHRLRIVHRDLKPSNIFITLDEDGEDYVKLLDFGISKVLDQDTGSITQSDVPVGTPYYMAPEQASGEVSDHRVDIFSVGVILYEILTGKRPFIDEDSRAIMYKSTAKPPQSPRRINPAIPKAIEKIILKALNRDPHRRFSTAEEMRKLLERSAPSSLWMTEHKGTADVTVQDLSKSSLLIPRIPIELEDASHWERYRRYYLVAALFVAVLIGVGLLWFR